MIVLAVQSFEEVTYRFYMFSSRDDGKVCPDCQRLDDLLMTRREIEARFPYLEKMSDKLWLPHVHPNCRCELRFEEEEEEANLK